MEAKKETKLKVMEALQEEAYKGIVRIDSETMHAIDVHPGDVVEIEGGRSTVGIVDRAYPTDVGQFIIRMDGILRRNAKTGIGENVKVRKADVKEATAIVIAPAQKGVMVRADPELFKRVLLGRAVVRGDIVVPGGVRQRRRVMSDSPFFDDVFNMSEESFLVGTFGLAGLRFIVVSTTPKSGPVLITEATTITLNPKAVEVSEEKVLEVTYEDIGGLSEEVRKVREMVELPLKHPEIFEKLGIQPPAGVLLHGPPGSGKTLLAKAVANESEANFILVNGPEIMNKFYGESERKIRSIFEEAEKNAPSIIFFDEIDAIAPKRDETYGEVERRVVSQLLTQMDGLKNRGKVVVIGATNRPNAIDPALRRPGRFDREVSIGVPNKEGRLNILKIHTRLMPIYNWDSAIAGKIIYKKLETFENEAIKKIKQQNNKVEELKLDLKNLDAELKPHLEELKLLQDQKKKSDPSVIDKILHRIGIKGEEISKINNKIEIIDKKVNTIKEEIKKLQGNINTADKIKENIDKKKESINNIVTTIDEINHSKSTWGVEDIRISGFLSKIKEVKDRELKENIEGLIEIGIIKDLNAFNNEVAKESVIFMIDDISSKTHGFVGADLSALTKEAAMNVLRRILPDLKLGEKSEIPKKVLENLKIEEKDFQESLKIVRPSIMREVLVETPNVKWEDIGGLKEVQEELKESIEWPLKNPKVFKKMGIKPPRGLLIYGPPGTGKTLLAKAVANESQANFISIKGPELLNKWVGESEKGVRKVFERARQAAPAIIFFDEIDAIAARRGYDSENGNNATERVVNSLLAEMDGLEELNEVIVIAATNRPDIIDPALLRPGRFDRLLLTPPPSEEGRIQIFKIHTKNMPLTQDTDLKELAALTEGFVGADIEALCGEAGIEALRENIDAEEVNMEHFKKALNRVKPSVSKEVFERYKEVETNYLRRARAGLKDLPTYLG